jgi:hypothetical protein
MTEILNIGGVRDRSQIINLGSYWKDVRREYSNGVLLYEGKHYKHNAPESDEEWAIWKYTTSNGDVRVEGPLVGSWTNRTGLDWGVSLNVAEGRAVEYELRSLEMFEDILYQLKLMNLHLMTVTEEKFNEGDLE